MSSAVTSNVKHYVGAIKEETGALGTVVQDEFVEVAGTISRNLPFTTRSESESTLVNQSPKQCTKNRVDGEMLADADPSERIEGESIKEIGQEWKELQANQRKWEQDNELCHDPLFPPGRILYLNSMATRPPQDSGEDGRSAKSDHEVPDVAEFVEVAMDEFSRVVLSNRMLLNHLCIDYERVLQRQAEKLESTPHTTSSPQT